MSTMKSKVSKRRTKKKKQWSSVRRVAGMLKSMYLRYVQWFIQFHLDQPPLLGRGGTVRPFLLCDFGEP